MSGWRTVVINKPAKLSLDDGRLQILDVMTGVKEAPDNRDCVCYAFKYIRSHNIQFGAFARLMKTKKVLVIAKLNIFFSFF